MALPSDVKNREYMKFREAGAGLTAIALTGDTAADDVDAGQPVKIGVVAASPTSLPTAVSVGDRVNLAGSTQGEAFIYETRLKAGEDQTNNVQAVCQKRLATNTYVFSIDQSAALEASSVTKASAGVIYRIEGRLDSTAGSATYYLQFINASSLPVDGAVTMLKAPYKIIHTAGTDDRFSFDFGDGISASIGIVFCLSSSEFTKTISGAYLSATVFYM